jgi:hypothetical protein
MVYFLHPVYFVTYYDGTFTDGYICVFFLNNLEQGTARSSSNSAALPNSLISPRLASEAMTSPLASARSASTGAAGMSNNTNPPKVLYRWMFGGVKRKSVLGAYDMWMCVVCVFICMRCLCMRVSFSPFA